MKWLATARRPAQEPSFRFNLVGLPDGSDHLVRNEVADGPTCESMNARRREAAQRGCPRLNLDSCSTLRESDVYNTGPILTYGICGWDIGRRRSGGFSAIPN